MSNECNHSRLFYTGLSCGAAFLGWMAMRRIGRKSGKRGVSKTRSSLPPARTRSGVNKPHPSLQKTSRHLYQTAATLSFSVLADSLLEHYRGCFANRAMYVAPVVAATALAESLSAAVSKDVRNGPAGKLLFSASVVTGIVGFGFHVYNIVKREGGVCWLNAFYAAPIGAPAALSMAGLFGLAAEHLQGTSVHPPRLLGMRAGRSLAALSAFGLFGTVGEVLLLHFRGAFQNPLMYVPVAVPTAAGGALATAALRPTEETMKLATVLVKSVGVLGIAGMVFHAYGIQRNMGGWHNWTQMMLQGPPLPAPPGFTGIALSGLAALTLLEEEEM